MLSAFTMLVNDMDAALVFFTQALGFHVLQDEQLSFSKRRVVVSPQAKGSAGIVLALAVTEQERASVGAQAAGKVLLFLTVNDIQLSYQRYLAAGVRFIEPPTLKPHGTVAIFLDVSGNRWDLIQDN
jgi:predicted enzyme related to lactoylglutathione lyase